MPSKAKNIMSMAVDLDIQEKLKRVAKKRDVSVSKLIRDLTEKFLNDDEEMDMVVLKVPKELRKSPEELKNWMDVKANSIVNALLK